MSWKKALFCSALLSVFLVAVSRSASAQSPLALTINYVDSTNFPDVRVYVTVLGPDGNPIGGLDKTNFSALEGGNPVALSNLSSQLDQMFAVLMLDTTGSMLDRDSSGNLPIDVLKSAATSFLNSMAPQDVFAVYAFNEKATLQCDFTTDRKVLSDCINNINAQPKDTALWDSAVQAINKGAEIPRGRRAVVLFTDGDDNLSKLTVDDVVSKAHDAEIPVYTIAAFSQELVNDHARLTAAQGALDRVSVATRARSLTSQKYSDLPQLFQTLSQQLKSQYVLEYTSSAAELRTDLSVGVNYKGLSSQDVLSYPVPAIQAAIPPLITQFDTAQFPAVTVHFSVPTVPAAIPVTPTLSNFVVQENGNSLAPTGLDYEKRGTLIEILDDASGDLKNQKGATQETIWKEQSNALLELGDTDKWLDKQGNRDSVGFVYSKKDPAGPSFPFSDQYNNLHNVAWNPDLPYSVPVTFDELLQQGVADFKSVPSDDGRRRMMIVLSTGIAANADTSKIQDAAVAAKENNIPVFVVFFGPSELTPPGAPESTRSAEYLKKIASLGNWRYYWYTSLDSIKPVYQQISTFGSQYALAYRSAASVSGGQSVRVSIRSSDQSKVEAFAQSQYSVDISAPQVDAVPPTDFKRTGTAWNSTASDAEPATMPIGVTITWPDHHPRKIVKLMYQFEGHPEETASNPGGDNPVIAVNVKDLDDGQYPLQIRAQDELGLVGTKQVAIPIRIVLPFTAQLLRAAARILPAAAVVTSLVLLILALYIYRTRPVIYQTIAKRVKETTESFLKPGAKDKRPAKAYLIPTGGDDTKQGVIEIRSEVSRFGRDENLVTFVLIDKTVSGLHCKIVEEQDGSFRLYDEGSRNGTFVNDEEFPIAGQLLRENDRIGMGRDVFQFKLSLSPKEKTEIFDRLSKVGSAKETTEIKSGPAVEGTEGSDQSDEQKSARVKTEVRDHTGRRQ